MSKDQVVSLLVNVVSAARTYACAGLALTKASMLALLGGAHVEDVITAARGGFEEAGEVIPAAWGSNLRRVAKAEMAQAVLDSDRALNNRLLDDLNVPKAKATGRPVKQTETKPAQVPAESRVDVREGAMVALQGILAAKAKLVPPAQIDALENAILAALAALRAAKPETK